MDTKGSNHGLISSTICHLPTEPDEKGKKKGISVLIPFL